MLILLNIPPIKLAIKVSAGENKRGAIDRRELQNACNALVKANPTLFARCFVAYLTKVHPPVYALPIMVGDIPDYSIYHDDGGYHVSTQIRSRDENLKLKWQAPDYIMYGTARIPKELRKGGK